MNPTTNIQYGSDESTKIIDDNGSTETIMYNYAGGERVSPTSRKYRIYHRTDKTDIATLERIAKNLINDPLKLDASLGLDKTKHGERDGYYNIVECYTVLEY